MLNKKNISRVIQDCWNIAENIPLNGAETGMFIHAKKLNVVRWYTYLELLRTLIPTTQTDNEIATLDDTKMDMCKDCCSIDDMDCNTVEQSPDLSKTENHCIDVFAANCNDDGGDGARNDHACDDVVVSSEVASLPDKVS